MYFEYDKYFMKGYDNYIKCKYSNRFIQFFQRIIFKIKKFLLDLVLDRYSQVMISNLLSEHLPTLYEKEKDLRYRTPTMSFTSEEIHDAQVINNKNIAYTETLTKLYLV